jgi:hypothetical protein
VEARSFGEGWLVGGLKGRKHKAKGFSPVNREAKIQRPERSREIGQRAFAGDPSGRFKFGVPHRAEALCFVLSGFQPEKRGSGTL